MAVAIRLKRMGRKKRPFYRVVVADTKKPIQGLSVDDLGYYDPMTEPPQVQIDEQKALIWLKEGAVPSETVRSLLSRAGVLQKLHEERQPHEVPPEEEAGEDDEEEAQAVEQADSEQEEP